MIFAFPRRKLAIVGTSSPFLSVRVHISRWRVMRGVRRVTEALSAFECCCLEFRQMECFEPIVAKAGLFTDHGTPHRGIIAV